jgi:hypothetical protein
VKKSAGKRKNEAIRPALDKSHGSTFVKATETLYNRRL